MICWCVRDVVKGFASNRDDVLGNCEEGSAVGSNKNDCCLKGKTGRLRRVKSWEIIADRLSAAGWSWGRVATLNSSGKTIFVADAHRDDGRRFIVHADEKLSAFVELEREVLTVTFYLDSIQ